MNWDNKEEVKEYHKQYYLTNKEKMDSQIKEYSLLHAQEVKTYQKEYYKTITGKYIQYKRRAKQRGIEFNLTMEQFAGLWQKSCYYCGDEIETIGIDRLDSDGAYTVGNITPCCTKCNGGKSTMTPNDYVKHCKKVIKNFSSKNLSGGN